MLEILVVSTVRDERLGILEVLNTAGHHVRGASTFHEAKRLLAEVSPDLVIADERLDAYNGLHVLLRARSDNPHVGAIVITATKKRGLETDARRLNVECAVKPHDPKGWLALVSKSLDFDRASGLSTVHVQEMIHAASI